MPVRQEEFPDLDFRPRSTYFSANECETLFWLVEESGIDVDTKQRLHAVC